MAWAADSFVENLKKKDFDISFDLVYHVLIDRQISKFIIFHFLLKTWNDIVDSLVISAIHISCGQLN